MAGNPNVLGLLEEMFESGKTPEEACRDCPELLPEVRQQWQQIQLIDAQVQAMFPGIPACQRSDATLPALPSADLPQVPGYEVEAVLGQGGMGVVYKARHLALKRTVALKMLAGYPHQAERARFRAEAEAVARLQHPNIVQIYEVGEADGRPFIALEYVAGGTLAERLAGQPLPPHDSARLVALLAEAMHLAHSRNLVHRDLKPSNVLLAGDGTPKVTDFGLVRQLDADSGHTFDGVVLGTPSYMAPEQALGRAHAACPATDVYALGAVLYECLTGRPPFKGATQLETLEQVCHCEPTAPSSLNREVPRDLETVCLKCLHKGPERRYSSARELADDLGRFLRGEPVAARPVGHLERAAMWMRRNPTVAFLSAVAALALVVGTVLSLLFGVQAHRKARELEEQTIQLQIQTSAAQENAQRAEENEKKVGRVLLSGMLAPIGRTPHKLTDTLDTAEVDAMRQLRAAPVPLRLEFLQTALRGPETARRVGRRADWVVQALVGCDRALRADVARLLVRQMREPDAPQEVKLACARLGLAVNLADPGWAERSADALIVELRDPQVERDDFPVLAEALATVSERLPRAQAADHAARALDVFLPILQDRVGLLTYHQQIGQAIVALSPALDAKAAARTAKEFDAIIRLPIAHPFPWPSVSAALAAVVRRLPASDGDAHVNRTVDFMLATRAGVEKKDKAQSLYQAKALGELCGRLDAARASRVAGAVIAMFSDGSTVLGAKDEFTWYGPIPSVLTKVAERLDAHGGLQAAEGLVNVLRRSSGKVVGGLGELRAALVAVCRRVDAAGAARVAKAMVAAVRDPKTSVLVRPLFADALAALAGRLTPGQAASLESALVDSLLAGLADAKSQKVREPLGRALATVCSRPGAPGAARAARALITALRDPQTPPQALRPLAAALAVVLGRLPPKEASSHAKEAVDVLDSLWATRKPAERPLLAEALAAVWARLGPADAAARAKRAADDLEDALPKSKTAPIRIYGLGTALAAVYNHLSPAERSRRANAVLDALVAARRRPRYDSLATMQLSAPLTTLCEHLDGPGDVRIADALLAVLDDPNVQPSHFPLYERMFERIAPRLDERGLQRLLEHPLAVGRLRRALLDVLARSKDRSFRNTWDYLDRPDR
jgi:tRNA A-37 threonylcarbamoyl transferase component Bud32